MESLDIRKKRTYIIIGNEKVILFVLREPKLSFCYCTFVVKADHPSLFLAWLVGCLHSCSWQCVTCIILAVETSKST